MHERINKLQNQYVMSMLRTLDDLSCATFSSSVLCFSCHPLVRGAYYDNNICHLSAAAEDDAVLVKNMGQSFRFSAVEARREERIKTTHDEAIFGGSSYPPPSETDDEEEKENERKENTESAPAASLLSDQVLTRQQGSWRDRARKT
ncbi:hypothetical protein CDL12_28335 [Handroanthus impetiginosus]|uniref:Uncharacterized protein n=1 Tax=Handroanthus impetiginosus TaxID=429701 RepID=A0A2G9G1I4_9LAMI|nr:hypothetical protein CDL12_28335 [Handroanthus impetiginosus]